MIIYKVPKSAYSANLPLLPCGSPYVEKYKGKVVALHPELPGNEGRGWSHAVVYNEQTQTFETVVYVLGLGSEVDASPELQQQFKKYCQRQASRVQVLRRRERRTKDAEYAAKLGIKRHQLYLLSTRVKHPETYRTVLRVLYARLDRKNTFLASCGDHVVRWLNSKELQETYHYPLSTKQLKAVQCNTARGA